MAKRLASRVPPSTSPASSLSATSDRRPACTGSCASPLRQPGPPPHLVCLGRRAPEIDDAIEVDIKEADLRIDTYRASGSGGQHVNRTDSAVRITHIPTNTVVQCQSERSQLKNRSTAMKMLRSRLYEEEQRKREAINAALYADKADVGWGSQIRSYVLAPYQMVKDLRTQHETSNTGGVLDGDIQPFIDTYLLQFANAMAARKGIAVAPSDEAY